MRKIDLTGNRYGKLVVIGFDCNQYYSGKSFRKWLCKCDCGNTISVLGQALKCGHTQSCGCLKEKGNPTHGFAKKERLYSIWRGIKIRCLNKNHKAYKYYGERGICVCDEWKNSYLVFKKWALENGYQEIILQNGNNKLTIDRIDNNGNYEPNNCRWVDMSVQNKNKRKRGESR